MFWKLYFTALPIFFALDVTWVGLVAKNFYAKQIGFFLRPDVNWFGAVAFYLLFTAGLVVFVLLPTKEKGTWLNALLLGAFFGLVTYATYDLTNLAITKNWPLSVTIVDMAWGTFVGGAACAIAYFIVGKIS